MKENPRKKQIVEAAARAVANRGYDHASIKEIAAEAGLAAPGLIHYYFKTKEEILREVLLQSARQYAEEMDGLRGEASPELFGPKGRRRAGETPGHEPEWYKLRYELFAQGLRNPELSAGVGGLMEIGRGGISGVLDSALHGLEEAEREALSAILLACFDGLALQKLLQPELDLEQAYALLEKMIVSRFPEAE
ncbi:TetR/AcrR family transcriptional regulator [Saccharibacillus sp. CPCC 101409]|uniref:TetR/AcrR family transcriptional regulator n=1 Tax=Saccharibacillus sp. CPCC 101409 TaxID=3058041 RepID=UPI002673FAF0|nr:TetR/AcrR family transcriptional regulator [Saccharibacillus sp. CPCC 101409]MDO3410029.1 TetR/AcrR family transcriptional regulator [Saccharibacillus sp. CPCC 101409]